MVEAHSSRLVAGAHSSWLGLMAQAGGQGWVCGLHGCAAATAVATATALSI